MISSIFIVNSSHDVILEKHYKSVIHRSICDYFFDVQKQSSNGEDIPPVIAAPHHYLYIVHHNTPPLMVIEVLNRIISIFTEYFDECSDSTIKENIVIVFELLDEILDYGYPLFTGQTNISEVLPTGQLSNVPWRRAGVKYANNEEIDAIIDKQGATISAEIHGHVNCCCKLSGMPDLSMTLANSRILDDVSFHPCVRFRRWENERILSFVPPDGNFCLLSYHISFQSVVAIPLSVRHNILLKNGAAGRFELMVSPKQRSAKLQFDRKSRQSHV
uniref:MHD domain-containing protein n=1 Tax=Globodera pallida TaxID=36090 RepID=A0A183CCL0_GLOPA